MTASYPDIDIKQHHGKFTEKTIVDLTFNRNEIIYKFISFDETISHSFVCILVNNVFWVISTIDINSTLDEWLLSFNNTTEFNSYVSAALYDVL